MIYKEYKGRLIWLDKHQQIQNELKDLKDLKELIKVTTPKKTRPYSSEKVSSGDNPPKLNLIPVKHPSRKNNKPPLPELVIRGETKTKNKKENPPRPIEIKKSIDIDKTELNQSIGSVTKFLTEDKTTSVDYAKQTQTKQDIKEEDFDSKFKLIMKEKTRFNTPISKFHRYQNSLVFTKIQNSELDEVVRMATSEDENGKLTKSPSLPNFSNEIIVSKLKLNKINSPPIEYPNNHERTRMMKFLKHFGSIAIFKTNSKYKSYKL